MIAVRVGMGSLELRPGAVAKDGRDRYFGGRPGEAAKARRRLIAAHGAVEGSRRFEELLSARREQYARRGRGTGLQRVVVEDDDG